MNLGLFLTPGDSLLKQKQSGQLDRFINYYLKPYSKNFSDIYLFSYGDNNQQFNLPSNIILIPKSPLIPYQFYQFFLPFIHKKTIKTINVFRVFQAIGGLPALITKWIYKKPYIATYGYHYHEFAQIEKQPLKAKLMFFLVKPILYFANKIIVTSNENKEYLKKLDYKEKIILIPNGVDPQIFKPDQSKQLLYLILTIGRLVHQKNHQLLLKVISFSKLKNKIKLIIIGQGKLQQSLQSQAEKLNINLKIIPSLPHNQLIKWYQKASIFTLTSRIEGQSKALLEAMSSGCVCLTTPFAGNLIKDNQTGIIGKNAQVLAEKLDDLFVNSHLRQKLSISARKQIIKNFDIKKLILKEIKLLVNHN